MAIIADLDPRKKYANRLAALTTERTTWVPHWQEVSKFIKPRSGRFLTTDRNKGTKKNGNIIDSTCTFASRTLAAGMMAGITSPARPWFRLATPDPDMMEYAPVRVWLSDVERIMRKIFASSNFYNAIQQLYGELGDFGTGNMAIMEDYDDVIRCQTHTIGSYMLATDHKNRVNAQYREFDMQVGQLVSDYGIDNVSTVVKTAFEGHRLDEWITVVHLIEVNMKPNPDSPLIKDKKFISKHYEKNSVEPRFLRESGFNEFPHMCPRWETVGSDVYGSNCPGMTALGDVKQLQAEQKDKGKGIARQMDPPMQGPTSLRGQGASTIPGSLTFIDATQGGQQFSPTYQVDPKLQYLTLDIQEVQERIRTAYFADLFLSITNMPGIQPRNNREIEERHEEKLLMLGPVLENLNDQLLDPAIDRTFNIASRAGILPAPPEELEGIELEVEYISVLAQAQKAVGVASITSYVGFVADLAAAQANAGLAPTALDKVDIDQAADEFAEMTGAPPKIVVSDDDVKEIRAGRAQAQQAAQAMQTAEQAANVASTAAGADTEGKNLLTDVMSGQGTPGGA